MDEFVEAFVKGRPDEEDRMEILADWALFRDMQIATGLSPLRYWVNGGFTTDKIGTSDVDFVTIFDGKVAPPDFAAAEPWIDPGPRWKTEPAPVVGRTLRVDAYGIVKVDYTHPASNDYAEGRRYWDGWFRQLRATGSAQVKGYVEVQA